MCLFKFSKFTKLFAYSLGLSFALPCCNFLGTGFNVCAMDSDSDLKSKERPYVVCNLSEKKLYFDVSDQEISGSQNFIEIGNLNEDRIGYYCPICHENKTFEFATICEDCRNMLCVDCYKKWYDASGKCRNNHQNINYVISDQKPILRFLSDSHLTNFTLNSINILKVLRLSDYSRLRSEIVSDTSLVRTEGFCFDEVEVIVNSPISKSIVELLLKGELILKFDDEKSVEQIVENLDLGREAENRLKYLVNKIYRYVHSITADSVS